MVKQIKENVFQDAIARNHGIVSSTVIIEAEQRLQEIENARVAEVLANSGRTRRRARLVFALAGISLFSLAGIALSVFAAFIFGTSLMVVVSFIIILAADILIYAITVGERAEQYLADHKLLAVLSA